MRRHAMAVVMVAAVGGVMLAGARPARAETGARNERDPITAGMLSIGVPLIGAGMISVGAQSDAGPLTGLGVAALVVGPTLGHIYAGNTWSMGLKMRVASLGVGLAGAAVLDGAEGGNIWCQGTRCEVGSALLFGAIGLYGAGTIVEMLTAPYAARSYNRRHASLTVLPMATPSGTVPAVSLGGGF